MSRRASAAALALGLLLAMIVTGSGVASAAPELQLSPASGPAGSPVTIVGVGFPAGEVELRWGGQSGPLLGTATGPDFSLSADVPVDAIPNSYPVVAVVREGSAVSTSNASYQVTPAGGVVETTVSTTAPPTTTAPSTTTSVLPAPGPDASSALNRNAGVDGGLDAGTTETSAPAATTPTTAPRTDSTATTATTAAPAAAVTPSGSGAAPPVTTTNGTPVPAASAGAPLVPAGAAGAGAGATQASTDDQRGDRALGAAATGQSSGAVRSPALLVAGLTLVLLGAGVMAVRNARGRAGG